MRERTKSKELSVQKTRKPQPPRFTPLQPLFCGIQIQPSGPCPSFCIVLFWLIEYIHDGYYEVDYYTAMVCPYPVQTELPTDGGTESVMDQKLLIRLEEEIIDWLQQYQERNHCKFMAAGISVEQGDMVGNDYSGKVYLRRAKRIGRLRLPARLWFELDVLPFILHTVGDSIDERACSAARKALMHLTMNSIPNLTRISVGFHHKVEVDSDFRIHLCDIEHYEQTVEPGTWQVLSKLAQTFRDEKINFAFFSSTPQGGGVALMRHSIMRIMNLMGVRASWYVTKPKPDVFEVTKRKFHNVLQGVAPSHVRLDCDDIDMYEAWCKENATRDWINGTFQGLDVVIIDDPQPSGLIPYIREVNPNCKIIYRIRSDLINQPGTEQHKVWSYLFDNFIQHADVFIAHPVANFVPANVDKDKVLMMPASTDPLDGLNKALSDRNMIYYQRVFNRICFDQTGKRVDFTLRPYIAQVCRFDPSKGTLINIYSGIPDCIRAYALLRKKIDVKLPLSRIPQLVIAGHGSIDDPDGSPVFEEILGMLEEEEYAHLKYDIIIVRVPPSDQILNALIRGAMIALQLSIREGFEIKVTEAIIKGVPIIAYASGGIPHQIKHGGYGFLVKSGDYEKVAEHLYSIIVDGGEVYNRIKSSCMNYEAGEEYFTVYNSIHWLYLVKVLHEGKLKEARKRAELKQKEMTETFNVKYFRDLKQRLDKSKFVTGEDWVISDDYAPEQEEEMFYEFRKWLRSGEASIAQWARDLWLTDETFATGEE